MHVHALKDEKKSFIFSSIKLWNDLSEEARGSLNSKRNTCICKWFQYPSCNYLYYTGNRLSAIFHMIIDVDKIFLKKKCSNHLHWCQG